MRLTANMFGSEFGPETEASRAFGIRTGQIRCHETVHNGGWYNTRGEKLGWGDLNPTDYARIQANLDEGDMFVILSEQDSFWAFVVQLDGPIGCMHKTAAEMYAPGIAYVKEHCFMLITKTRVVYVSDYADDTHVLNREDAAALIDVVAQLN